MNTSQSDGGFGYHDSSKGASLKLWLDRSDHIVTGGNEVDGGSKVSEVNFDLKRSQGMNLCGFAG